MSSSWIDPHFTDRFERREELRLAERLLRLALQRERRLSDLPVRPNLRLL